MAGPADNKDEIIVFCSGYGCGNDRSLSIAHRLRKTSNGNENKRDREARGRWLPGPRSAICATADSNEAELDAAIAMVDSLGDRKNLADDENDYLLVLSSLIENYEDDHYPIPEISGLPMLKSLLEFKCVTQAQASAQTGIAGINIFRDPRRQANHDNQAGHDAGQVFPSGPRDCSPTELKSASTTRGRSRVSRGTRLGIFADFRGVQFAFFALVFLGGQAGFSTGRDGSVPRSSPRPVPAAGSGEPLGRWGPGPSLSDGVRGPSHPPGGARLRDRQAAA